MPVFSRRQRQIVSPIANNALSDGLVVATIASDHRGLELINRVDGALFTRSGTPTRDNPTEYGYGIDGNGSGYWSRSAADINTGPVTFFLRSRTEAVGSGAALMSIGNVATDGTPRLIFVNFAGEFRIYWNQGYQLQAGAGTLVVGTDMSGALVVGGSSAVGYLNGLPLVSTGNTFAVNNGNTFYVNNGFQGPSQDEIYEVFVWKRELSADEIRTVHDDSSQLFYRPSVRDLFQAAAAAGGGGPLVNAGLTKGALIRGGRLAA